MENVRRSRLPREFWLVAGCFLISGFAALLYETVWLRQFAILLGTSEQALAVVLASYMGGLAIGSLVASRVVDAVRRPLLTYGLLEFGIAVSALFVPVGIVIARSVQRSLFGGLDYLPSAGSATQVLFCLSTAFSLILVPTALMGATLPLLARHVVSRDEDLGPRIGLLYAINTAGAVAGTLVAAFLCLPAFGLGKTVWIGAACNVGVFGLVLLAVRGASDRKEPTLKEPDEMTAEAATDLETVRDPPSKKSKRQSKSLRKRDRHQQASEKEETEQLLPPPYHLILALAAISGAVSFSYEIIFTRMLGHMLGGSVYAFATMLAGFLLGIALGGAIAARLATTRQAAAIGFVYAQALAAIATLIAFQMVNQMCAADWQSWGGARSSLVQIIASMLALLPTATCIGATFPLAIRVYAKDEREAARGAARVYGWNVVGAIVGSLATGAIILPWLQYHNATALAVLMNILIAAAALLLMQVRSVHGVSVVAALLCLIVLLPTQPENVIRVSAINGTLTSGDVLYNHVGRSATVTVFDDAGQIYFQTNGLPESRFAVLGSTDVHRNTGVWLTALPPLIRPQMQSMMIIGLGGGVAAANVAPSVKSIDVIELEPAVVSANQRVAGLREHDPLTDPRVKIVINDGRNALVLSDKRYDTIVSQPSHPWTAGASHLYTREFNQLAHDHLNPGGVFLQWMNATFVDQQLLLSMGATLLDVFQYVRLYQPIPGTFMFVASDQPMRPEDIQPTGELTRCAMAEQNRSYYRRLGIVTPTHLLAMLTWDHATVKENCSPAPIITDEQNLLAMRAPRLMQDHDGKLVETFVAGKSPISQSLNACRSLCPSFDLRAFGGALIRRDDIEIVEQFVLPRTLQPLQTALIRSALIRATKPAETWRGFLDECLDQFPESGEFAYMKLTNALFARGEPLERSQRQQLESLLSDEHRLIVGLIESMKQNDFASLRQADEQLASIPVDDIGFEMAVRLRIPWRLEAPPAERIVRAREALVIMDSTAPFSNSAGLAFFRCLAAINANQPLVALGTASQLAHNLQLEMDQQDRPLDPAGLANLKRILAVITQPVVRDSVPRWRYQETVLSIDEVLLRAGDY